MRHYRRAVGFSLQIDPRRDDVLITPLHRPVMNLSKARLKEWMALNHFSPTTLPAHILTLLQDNDLVYYADHAARRTTTGAPLAKRRGAIALRGNVKVTPMLRRGDDLSPFDFMPRRHTLDNASIVGAQFRSLEFERAAYTVTLAADADFGQRLRALLPRLNGRQTWQALSADEDILDWLDCAALLTDDAPPAMPLGDVCWLGHAAVLACLGAANIVIDPIFFTTPEPRRPWQPITPDWRTLPALDAIAITHGDNDHLHASALVLLDPKTPIVIAKAPAAHDYQVDIEAMLGLLGFGEIISLDTWEKYTLKDTEVQATPFDGEDWGLVLQKSTFVVRGPKGAVYLGADSRANQAALERIGAQNEIALAFLGVSGCAEPFGAHSQFGYGDFYRAALDKSRRNEWWEHCAGPDEAAQAARWLGAKAAFGYAAGGGPFIGLAHSDSGDHAAFAALLDKSIKAVALPLGEAVSLRNP